MKNKKYSIAILAMLSVIALNGCKISNEQIITNNMTITDTIENDTTVNCD